MNKQALIYREQFLWDEVSRISRTMSEISILWNEAELVNPDPALASACRTVYFALNVKREAVVEQWAQAQADLANGGVLRADVDI